MKKNTFKGKKILIMGLGLHGGGVGIAKFFCQQGADVLVTDLKTETQLKESLDKLKGLKIKYTLGKHEEADFKSADIIIKNPDVPNTSPYLEIARKNNIPVETDVDLFFKMSGAFVIGVTGTKGKSTTASIIYHILKQKSKRVFLAGNIGISPLELLTKTRKGDIVILELSSFELESLFKSPNIAVVTNILPDHLNRYATMADYVEAKKIIFKYQKKSDCLVLNADDYIVRQFSKEAPSKIYFFSAKQIPKGINLADFKLNGKHNLSNLLAAVKVAEILKLPTKRIEKSLKSFKGIASRQELVAIKKGVKYINDTTATMPDAVIRALETFKNNRIVLIAGGQNKGLQYKDLAKEIIKTVYKLVLLPGTASQEIEKELAELKSSIPIIPADSMEEAVRKSSQIAEKGDVVLLSPGATSFNLFKNEFDRGNQFVEYVKKAKPAD